MKKIHWGSRIVSFILTLAAWLVFTSFTFTLVDVVVGVVCALIVAGVFGDIYTRHPEKFGNPVRYLYFFVYVPVFVWEMIKANLDVAYRVLHPRMPIRPAIVKVPTKLTDDTAMTFLGSSLTLTPGTTTVDIDREQRVLYVHCLTVDKSDLHRVALKRVAVFENILAKIFE